MADAIKAEPFDPTVAQVMKSKLVLIEFDTVFEGLHTGPRGTFSTDGSGQVTICGKYIHPHHAGALAILLSSAMQRFIQEVFLEASMQVFRRPIDDLARYSTTIERWGNPYPENIQRLFSRIGVFDIFTGNGMQDAEQHAGFLRNLNAIRNKLAHGGSYDGFRDIDLLEDTVVLGWRANALDCSQSFTDFIAARTES